MIAISSRRINLLVTNNSDSTLVITPPQQFGAVHVLAQFGGQFPGGGQGFGAGPGFGAGAGQGFGAGAGQGFGAGAGQGGGAGAGAGMGGGQALGGGFGNGAGQGQFGGAGGGNFGPAGGGFRVRDNATKNQMRRNKALRSNMDQHGWLVEPGKTRRFTTSTVCLDYGKPDPSPRMHYKIVRLEELGRGQEVSRICSALANSQIDQPIAQALAWRATTEMGWDEIARINRIESRYTGNVRYFSPQNIRQAMAYDSRENSKPETTACGCSMGNP